MADRVAANITIGGSVTAKQFSALAAHIADYDLRVEWGGEPFDAGKIESSKPLRLYAEETAWGVFETLEQYCCNEHIPYVRWSGAYPGSFGAERIVYDGKSGPLNFAVDDDDQIVLLPQTIEWLGSMRAIRAYIRPASFAVPPFAIT